MSHEPSDSKNRKNRETDVRGTNVSSSVSWSARSTLHGASWLSSLEPGEFAARAPRESSRLASAHRYWRMVPPSPHVGGAVTPHASRGYNKENTAGMTPGAMAYGTTPGAKTNAESVAEVR